MQFGSQITADQVEILTDLAAPIAVGGDSDWRIAVFLYVLTEPLSFGETTVPAGTYLREVRGNHVIAYPVTGGDPAGYVDQIEAEFTAWDESSANMRLLPAEIYAARIIAMINAHVADGTVPATVTDWSGLAEYVDENTYYEQSGMSADPTPENDRLAGDVADLVSARLRDRLS